MIFLDTSVLVEGLGAGGTMRGSLRDALARRERMIVPTLVLYEWLRVPSRVSTPTVGAPSPPAAR